MKNYIYLLIIILVVNISCEPYNAPEPTIQPPQMAENADLSSITFVGGSRLAGLEDGAINQRSVSFSIPHLILSSGEFAEDIPTVIPFSHSTNGFNVYENTNIVGSQGKYLASFTQPDTTSFKRFITTGEALNYTNANTNTLRSFAFAKANVLDFTDINTSNPFINSFYPNLAEPLAQRAATNAPSFLVFDAGMQDIVSYALNGAEGNADVSDVSAFQTGDLLSESVFRAKVEELTAAFLSANPDSKGLLMNIPNILNFPMFIKLRFDITPFIINNSSTFFRELRADVAAYNQQLLSFYSQNPGVPSSERRPLLDFASDTRFNWGILVEDNDLSDVTINGQEVPKIRQAKWNEFVLFRGENDLSTGYGAQLDRPVSATGFISETEANLILSKIQAYNAILEDIVANSDDRLAIANTDALFEEMFMGLDRFLGNPAQGITVDGVLLEPLINEFGIFSTDGINLNPLGNVLLSNVIIDAINDNFSGTVRHINPNSVPGTDFKIGAF